MTPSQIAILKKIDSRMRAITTGTSKSQDYLNYALGLMDALLEESKTK
jgi:hypothetical protein